jgi:hypothetical protein
VRTIKCQTHETLVVVLEPQEEALFSADLDATVVFFDGRGRPYLKRFVRGGCDDNCPEVRRLFRELERPKPVQLER